MNYPPFFAQMPTSPTSMQAAQLNIPQSTKVDLDFCVDMIMAAVQKSFQEQLPDIIREVVREELARQQKV